MKYLCLCYYDTEKFASLSKEQLEAIPPACTPYDKALRATGKVLVVGSLSEPQDWRTIKPEQGKPVVTAGPISSASQQAGAFLIIEADSMDEATAVASNHPAANFGGHVGFAVDVRPCVSYD